MMPICDICLVSPNLCEICKAKLEKGEITKLDVFISKFLHKMFRKGYISKNPSFIRAIELEDMVILLTDQNPAYLIGIKAKVLKDLSQQLGKKVKIINIKEGVRSAVRDYIYPEVRFQISKLYLPDGKTITKIKIPKSRRINVKEFERILETVFNEKFKVEIL
jgi:transcription antitermination factor NusA-like protein